MAKYNLLQAMPDDDDFAVEFDLCTPRPHFLILPKSGKSINPEFSRITSEQTEQLIKTGMSALACFGIDDGVLSIHRGRWRTIESELHVHVCVHFKSYLRVFNDRKTAIPNWPDLSGYVTNEWRYERPTELSDLYEQIVRGYPYKKYFNEDVNAINSLGDDQDPPGDDPLVDVPLKGGITKIVYHFKQPKVGFVGPKTDSAQELREVLLTMESFAKTHGLTESESNDGCHICLCLASTRYKVSRYHDCWLLGYIVTSGSFFYERLCPKDRRKKWFSDFKGSSYNCET